MPSASYFRVGDNVELWRVTEFLCVIVACVMLFEQVLHKVEHASHKYPKYHEMLSKVYRELMILGLIGLGVKMVKEVSLVSGDGKNILAFQVADLAIFILALALIIQAICVFTLLRSTNKAMDRDELVNTDDLLEVVMQHQLLLQNQSCFRRFWPWGGGMSSSHLGIKGKRLTFSAARYDDMVTMRTLRHYFLRRYKLPQLFPFAKYLRQAQDNQITHMIDVEVSAWILLVLIAWALDAATVLLEDLNDEVERHAVVSIFLVFSWALTLLHWFVSWYLSSAIMKIRATAGYNNRQRMVECLRKISLEEVQLATNERGTDAMECMQRVQEQQEAQQLKNGKTFYFTHDTGFQLIEGWFKKCCTRARNECHDDDASTPVELENGHQEPLPRLPQVEIAGFSRKGIHFVVKFLLMLNGFYFALMCQCVLYEMGEVYTVFGPVPAFMVPMPLVINMIVFQPKIFRNFILVSSIFSVDVTTLSEVISHFSESMELRSDFVAVLTQSMKDNGQTAADLHLEFVNKDPTKSGFIEIEDLRVVLHHFGCHVSYFRFNGIAKLLFRLKGTKVEYAQVERLIQLADEEDKRTSSIAIAESRPSSMIGHMRYRSTVIKDEIAARGGPSSSFVLQTPDAFALLQATPADHPKKSMQSSFTHFVGGRFSTHQPSQHRQQQESSNVYTPVDSRSGHIPMLSTSNTDSNSQYRSLL
ncbi:hypothetical protein FI667_g8406, partial [Globisporangium splendens]